MFDISRSFKVDVQGRGPIHLGPQDHVASGGEGHVYRKSGGRGGPSMAIKIWDDPGHAAAARMPQKIGLLAATLADPRIVAPEALVCDASGQAVGYVMPWVQDGWALTFAFTNDWRRQNGFGDDEALGFAERMRAVVEFVHGRGVVMGDANELNVLGVGRGAGAEPRYIDVDPWILPGFQGDKVLPTVHDHHSARFSQEADWFAWAVTTFQLMTGVHPYRGTHPGYPRNDMASLTQRMMAQASVFDPGVRFNAAVRSFDRIPTALLDYYRSVFSAGRRGPPPSFVGGRAASPAVTKSASQKVAGGDVKVTSLYEPAAPVLGMVARDALMLEGGILVSLEDGRTLGRVDAAASVVRGPGSALHAATAVDGMVRFGTLQSGPGQTLSLRASGIAASSCWSADNRLFAVVHDGILEVAIRDMASGTTALAGRKWTLNPNSTAFGQGIALYDALGARFLVVPFGGDGVAIIRVRELDGLRAVAMTRTGRTAAMTLIDGRGAYKRAVLVFSETFGSVTASVENADSGELGDVITESGVLVRFTHGGQLELSVPATGNVRTADMAGQPQGRLLCGPAGVFVTHDGKISRISVS